MTRKVTGLITSLTLWDVVAARRIAEIPRNAPWAPYAPSLAYHLLESILGAVMLRETALTFFAEVEGEPYEKQLDALIYPTWSNVPRLIGYLNTPGGDNNQFFAPSTGFPAITVPMGYTRNGTLPAGLQFFGRAWSEAALVRLAYAYERATHHRRPPKLQ